MVVAGAAGSGAVTAEGFFPKSEVSWAESREAVRARISRRRMVSVE
jgi:hypothetical protein